MVLTLENRSTASAPKHAIATPSVSRSLALLGGAAGFAVAFVAAYLLFVHTTGGQQVENGAVRNAQLGQSTSDWSQPLREVDMIVLLGAASVSIVLISLVRRRFSLGVAGLVALAGPVIVSQILKLYVLERPRLGERGLASHNSFPSGHVTAAMAIVVALAIVLPRRFRSFVLLAGGAGVAWVSSATISLGWHRFSDTIGASLLVAAFGFAVAAMLSRRHLARVGVAPAVIAAVAPLLFVLAGYAILSTATSGPAQFVAAMVLAAVSAIALAGFQLWQLRRVVFDIP
ncbi:phosphatase PAP2 family protein [Amycolatopsis sp. cg5]|uniref:phosphatase PAP2 family protein n=1 Tax=Amycolatopsis sp. cg5 TaxID=3238802 RepID=UPI003523A64E